MLSFVVYLLIVLRFKRLELLFRRRRGGRRVTPTELLQELPFAVCRRDLHEPRIILLLLLELSLQSLLPHLFLLLLLLLQVEVQLVLASGSHLPDLVLELPEDQLADLLEEYEADQLVTLACLPEVGNSLFEVLPKEN